MREGGRENKERLATRNCLQWRTNGTTPPLPFPGPCFFVRFPGQLPRLQRGGPCAKECKEAHLLGRRGNKKKTSLRKPKERGQEDEKSERPDKSKRFVFLIFLFFSSHTPVVHLPSVFEFYERKAPRRALRLISLLCAKLQSSGKSVSFEPSSRASCSRSLLGSISFPPSGRDKVSGEGNNQQAKRRGKKGEGASEARDQAV